MNIIFLEVYEDGSVFMQDKLRETVNVRGIDPSLIGLIKLGLEKTYGAGHKVVEVEEIPAVR